MMRHLTRADYLEMPWANGRGKTIEILRNDDESGMLWRFSMATVAENGPFSQFKGIERNLTVIDGPGFDLRGDATYRADPLRPVAFPGDFVLSAQNVTGVAVDFNVMTRRTLRRPDVDVVENGEITARPDATLCIFALGAIQYGGASLKRHDFLWDAPNASVNGGKALVINLFRSIL